MNQEEFLEAVKSFEKEGLSEDQIVLRISAMFQDGKISRQDYEKMLDTLGYGLDEEFAKMTDDELRKNVVERDENTPREGADVEEAKGDDAEGEEPKQEAEAPESEDEERRRAMRMFGLSDD